MDKRYIVPYRDMYNIHNLITKINKNYSLCFDKKNKCFLIMNFSNNEEICLMFKEFNFNIIERLQKTQISNAKNIFRKIDESNEKLFYQKEKQLKNNVYTRIEDLNWLSKRTNIILPSDIKKIVEV